MQTILSSLAMTISLIALLFGGLINGQWSRVINAADITASVSSVTQGYESPAQRKVSVPQSLVQDTTRATYFDSLKPEMSREELERLIETSNNISNVTREFTVLLSQMTASSANANELEKLWNRTSQDSKARLFAFRAARKMHMKFRRMTSGTDQKQLSDIVDHMLADRAESKTPDRTRLSAILTLPGVKEALTDVIGEVAQTEAHPDPKLIAIIQEELPGMQVATFEADKFIPEIKKLLANEDASRSASLHFDFVVTFLNEGAVPESISPGGVVALRGQSRTNLTMFVIPQDSKGNIVVEPGKAVTITFRSDAATQLDLPKLVSDFKSGERDFRILFQTSGRKKYVVTPVTNLSARVDSETRKTMIEMAESTGF